MMHTRGASDAVSWLLSHFSHTSHFWSLLLSSREFQDPPESNTIDILGHNPHHLCIYAIHTWSCISDLSTIDPTMHCRISIQRVSYLFAASSIPTPPPSSFPLHHNASSHLYPDKIASRFRPIQALHKPNCKFFSRYEMSSSRITAPDSFLVCRRHTLSHSLLNLSFSLRTDITFI